VTKLKRLQTLTSIWLDITDRILFRTAVTVYRCVHGIAPD